MGDFSIEFSRVRKKLYEDINVGAQQVKQVFQQPMAKINSAEIGNRLLTGDIHPTSSSAASSL